MSIDPSTMIQTLNLQLFHYDLDENLKLAIAVIINMMRRIRQRFRKPYHILHEHDRQEIESLATTMAKDICLLELQIQSGIGFCAAVRRQLHSLMVDINNGASISAMLQNADLWLKRMPQKMPTRHISEGRIFQSLAEFYHQILLKPILSADGASPKHPAWVVQSTLTRLGFHLERLCSASKDFSSLITKVKRDWDRALQASNESLPSVVFADLLDAASAYHAAEGRGLLSEVTSSSINPGPDSTAAESTPTGCEHASPFPLFMPTWQGFNDDTRPRYAFSSSKQLSTGHRTSRQLKQHRLSHAFSQAESEADTSQITPHIKQSNTQRSQRSSSSSTPTETPRKIPSKHSLAARIKKGFRRRFSDRDYLTSSSQTSLERSFPIPDNYCFTRYVSSSGEDLTRCSNESTRAKDSAAGEKRKEARSGKAFSDSKAVRSKAVRSGQAMPDGSPPRSFFRRKRTV